MDENTQIFREKFKTQLIEWLQLEEMTPDQIIDDEPIFGAGMNLDSLDAVEIVILLQRKYSIPQKEMEGKREIFQTFATLSDFVQNRGCEK